MPDPRLALVAPWFGPWPVWINLYLESCRWNPEITWLIPTDQDPPACQPPNVTFLSMTLAEFTARAAAVTGLPLVPSDPYKICDFKPLIGEMFADELRAFTHFGYTDNDIIYGQLACELTPERLATYEIISSHANLQAGHLTVMQNTRRVCRAWRHTPKWRRHLQRPDHTGFDERAFGRRIDPNRWHPPWRRFSVLWHEMFSMPDRGGTWPDGGRSPQHYHWHKGRLTDARGAKEEYAYLHFMFWRSGRYRSEAMGPAPWDSLDTLMHVAWPAAAETGFDITRQGFLPHNSV